MKNKLTFLLILYVLLFLFFWFSALPVESTYDDSATSPEVSKIIRSHVLLSDSQTEYLLNGNSIYSFRMLRRFYKTRNFRPAWITNARSFKQAQILVDILEDVESHGLIAEYYHADSIKNLMKYFKGTFNTASLNPDGLAELDILLTDAFLTLGCHFSGGCVAALIAEAEWYTNQNQTDMNKILETALLENTVKNSLEQLLPVQDSYAGLRNKLKHYRRIEAHGRWPKIRISNTLKRGDSGVQVHDLRERLAASDDLVQNKKEDIDVFDQILEQAVIRFQRRHGLNADGIVGPVTAEAINVPLESRIRQIEFNLERMRWTSRNLGDRYIIVNIAGFQLDVIEKGSTVMSMDVIVGKPYWHTPVLSETMTYIVLNPSWNIPSSIAKEEILPAIQEDPDYLKKRNIKIYSDFSDNATEINPGTVRWFEMTEDDFNYKLIQEPGPSNPLGKIKFIFPNTYNVYLHDTPGKGLFSKNVRSFSHGCIRIEKPLELAEYLLSNNHYSREKILSAIKDRKQHLIPLAEPVRIHLVYHTAWVDEQGTLQFRDDIYGRDERLYMALLKKPARLTNASKMTFVLH